MKPCSVWLSESDTAYLDAMVRDGGFKNRSSLIRSLLRAIIDDDRKAHQEAA